MLVGYINNANNKQALVEYGCENFTSSLEEIKSGDTLIITSLFDLAANQKELLERLIKLFDKKAGIVSVDGKIFVGSSDVNTIGVFLKSIGEFRKEVVSKRTKIGLKKARDRGKLGGRFAALTIEQAKELTEDYKAEILVIGELTRKYGVSKTTLYRILKGYTAQQRPKPTPIIERFDDTIKTQDRVLRVDRSEIAKYQIFK